MQCLKKASSCVNKIVRAATDRPYFLVMAFFPCPLKDFSCTFSGLSKDRDDETNNGLSKVYSCLLCFRMRAEAKANALPAGQGYTTPSAHASSSKPQKQVNLGIRTI
jgi:hypothetical protein